MGPETQHEKAGESLASGYSRRRLYSYLAPIVLLPIAILAAALIVVPTDWFADRSDNLFMDTLGYGASLHNANCQIAVYGDSTAVVGINPFLIREKTGLSTCNIAEVAGVNVVDGTMPLDQYLAQNSRPRYLVFLFAPEGLNPESQRHNPEITTFEGVTYRFRQPHKLASFIALMRHPDDIFSWAEHGIRMSLGDLRTRPMPPETKYTRFRTLGQTTFTNPPMTTCNYPHHNPRPDLQWIHGLRTKYGIDGTTVLIDATLLPACDPDLAFFRQQLAGVIDNNYEETLPMADYYAGGRHVFPAGADALSWMVADQILAHMHSQASSDMK